MLKQFKILGSFLLIIQISIAQNVSTPYSQDNQLDINNAGIEEISKLPVSKEIAIDLYQRILYRGNFKSVYELRRIDGIDQRLFNQLKPLIRIEPFSALTTVQEKIEQIYYRLERWSSSEGVNDAFIDLWIEKALDPMNVNKARYNELVNLQNVSPIDAAAIINHRKDVHWISTERNLRYTPGLSNYAYRTARYFLDYKDVKDGHNWHGNIMLRIDNTPFMADEGEQAQEAGLSAISGDVSSGYNLLPNVYYKARFSFLQDYKMGFSYSRNLNEPTHYLNEGSFRIPDGKFYLGLENLKLGVVNLRKLYLGNYSVTLGQGIIMENTDFFTPRKSGYGFRKRFKGISGDNSRTRQYTLKGIAAEADYKNISAIGFVSYDSRDAILNKAVQNDSLEVRAFNQLIVLDQRFEYALDDESRGPDQLNLSWLDAVNELTYGGHLQYDFIPGTYLGLSLYESAYDRPLEPHYEEIVEADNLDRLVTADSEIKQSYGGSISRSSNPFWADALSFRRVYGFDFQTVINNVAIQGEWGELDKGGSLFKLGDDPKAFVVSAYAQFPTFNILALYRNYDVGFDNPYQRSFSNYHRFKGSIYEDYYYLQSVLYGQLYENNPQPQSEEGFYLNSFYQVNRKITARFQYDNWIRKPDGAKHYRLVGTVDYRPVFPLRIQLRQKWQAREEDNDITIGYYKNLEFRGRIRMRLSNYNSLGLMYTSSKLIVHPRPRVFGDMVLDGQAITANYIHNFNKYLKITGMLSYYKGFLWNFEDTQFVVMDSEHGAIRYWLSVYMRLNSYFSMRLKYTAENHKPGTSVNYDPWESTINDNPGKMFAADCKRNYISLFYVEFNYNF